MTSISLSGSLEFLNLGELIQIFGTNGSTGIMKIKSKYFQEPGLIYFVKGNIVNAEAGAKQGLDAVYALFGWIDGEFEFSREDVKTKNTVQKSRMEITLDALSMLDDGQIEKLGPVSYTKAFAESSEKESTIPVIRGPLVDYTYVVDEEEHYDGDSIVAEGKFGNWIWTILEGTVEIIKETPQGTITILRLTDGAFVGSISAVMPGQNVRSASAVAAGTVQLGLLDSQRLYGEYTKLSNELKEMIKSLDSRLKKQTTMLVDINSGKVKINEMLSGKKIFMEQGTTNTNAYIIMKGEALIARNTKKGYLPILSLSAGDFIGHLPFINIGQEPHSASVYASKDLEVSPFDIDNIHKEYDQLSVTFKNILENLGTCISATTMVASEMYKKSTAAKK